VNYSDEFYISLIGEVFDGYSTDFFEGQEVFVKHLNIRDQRYIHNYYEKYKKIALLKGIDSESAMLERLKKDGMWDAEDDLKISSLESEISNLKKTRDAIFLPSQKEVFTKNIEDKSKEFYSLKSKRAEVVGVTAESYATSRCGDEMLRFSLFKDSSFEDYLFSEEEFAELEVHQVINLGNVVNGSAKRLGEENIKWAVLRPFFSMYLSNCENINDFYGQAVVTLSVYQLKVAMYGKVFHSIFQYTDDIPDNIKEDPDKLMAFSENQRNKDSGKVSSGIRDDADASAVFGATKEDMQQIASDGKTVSLSEEMEKAGGKLNMEQMMRLAGHDV
tara:strand:- start:149 stop:1144 length:996 start_codon:yes stop_codon:yes gene_type:complete